MRKNSVITLLFLTIATLGYLLYAQTPATGPAPLGKVLADLRAAPEFRHTLTGFCLLDDRGRIIATHNADLALIPASSLKTLTSATALEVLGPDFTFSTELRATAPIAEDGTLDGDLLLQGGGDPTLALADLQAFVKVLREKGLRNITGRVLGDATFFPENIAGEFWNWSDVGNGYGSPCAGLNLDHNRATVRFQPAAQPGPPAQLIESKPTIPGLEWINRVTTGPADSGDAVRIYGGPYATTLLLEGTVPAGTDPFNADAAVPDPARFAAHHLDRLLRQAEITIGKDPATVPYDKPAKAPELLHTHQSAKLPEIITHLHDVSDNHEAECLYRLLGVRAKQDPATAIRAHWKSRGLELPSLRLVDGSGLGRANTISSHDLARLQFVARTGPHGTLYHDSLVTGLEGALHYKAGAMSGIHTFTGFLKSSAGKEYAFALQFNHALTRQDTSRWTNRILEAVSNL